MPASATASPSNSTPSGSWGAGLITTVLPAASAGATFPATFTSGMLYGVMQATTPTGWRFTVAAISPAGPRAPLSAGIGATSSSTLIGFE